MSLLQLLQTSADSAQRSNKVHGVVTGIVGIRWWDVVVEGVANHAGTTPMGKRYDPMLAAADFVLMVNEVVRSEEGTQVGTVGRITAEPGETRIDFPGCIWHCEPTAKGRAEMTRIDAKFADVETVDTCVNYLNNVEGFNDVRG